MAVPPGPRVLQARPADRRLPGRLRRASSLVWGGLLHRTILIFVIGYAVTGPAIYFVYLDQERAYQATLAVQRAAAADSDIADLMLAVSDQRLAIEDLPATGRAAAVAAYDAGGRAAEAAWRDLSADSRETGLEPSLPAVRRALDAWQGWADAVASGGSSTGLAGDTGQQRYQAVRRAGEAYDRAVAGRVDQLQRSSDDLQQIAIRDNVLVTVEVIALVSVVVALLLGTTIRSIGRLVTTARQLSGGVDVAVPYLGRNDEVGQLARSLANWQSAEAARRAATDERNVLLEQAPVGICRLDVDGRVITGNRTLQSMFGWRGEEVRGRPFPELVHADDRGRDLESFRLLASGGLSRMTAESRFLRHDGGLVWCASVTTPLRGRDGQIEGFIAIVEDITERRRQSERAARIQRQLLPQFAPRIAGYELAGACLPAQEVAGDFYDWVVGDDGQVELTVADVMGKGVGAALVMTALRTALRSAPPDLGPADQVGLAARSMPPGVDDEGLFATMFHAHLDSRTGLLRYVDAGHGYCAIRRASGDIAPLSVRSLPIGVPADGPFRQGSAVLEPSDALLVYSDGLVETPERTVPVTDLEPDFAGDVDARDVVRRLMARVPSRPADDVTVLVLRRLATSGDSSPAAASVELDVQCSATDRLDVVHDALAKFWQGMQPTPGDHWRMLFELAVAEVAANVFEHALPTLLSLSLRLDGAAVCAEFEYVGQGWTDPPQPTLPDPMAERGRGLFLARTGVDEVAYQRDGMAVAWRLIKRL